MLGFQDLAARNDVHHRLRFRSRFCRRRRHFWLRFRRRRRRRRSLGGRRDADPEAVRRPAPTASDTGPGALPPVAAAVAPHPMYLRVFACAFLCVFLRVSMRFCVFLCVLARMLPAR